MNKKYKVLIVDDDCNNATLLGRFLTINCFDVKLTANIFAMAKDLIVSNMPHIVLLEKGMGGSADERNKIADYLIQHYHLPVILITHDEQPIFNLTPSLNCIYVPFPKITSHYFDHILVAIDNMLNPEVIKQFVSRILELKVKIILLNKSGEPVYKKNDKIEFCKIEVDLNNIDSMRSNNLCCKNSSILWIHNNNEYCLQENTSLTKLSLRHKDFKMIRISKQELVNEDMIDTFVLHRTVKIGNRILDIGKGYKKSIDAILLSIPRLNPDIKHN